MNKILSFPSLIVSLSGLLLSGSQIVDIAPRITSNFTTNTSKTCQSASQTTDFLVMAGGGNPGNNEIALEKNVLYFQRTLKALGYNPANANVFFANGNNGQATVRYIDENSRQQFKVPNIPNLQGAATLENFNRWLNQTASKNQTNPVFFYFTGHGIPNAMILWGNRQFTVQELAQKLNLLPQDTPVVTMMAQCYSGSFANFIYEQGNPNNPIALQTRCGFFATIATLPSVGCTPEVNEADYKDYSSSFFAGLSGISRTGEKVASADYNQDGVISFAEAHGFAKVDEQSEDLPISTSEVWLQEQISSEKLEQVLSQPITNLLVGIRPEQKYVVTSLASRSNFDLQKSFIDNLTELFSEEELRELTEVQKAYLDRLIMELTNIAVEKQIRASKDEQKIAILERLLKCEASSWQ